MGVWNRLFRYGAIAGAMVTSYAIGVYSQNPPYLRHLHAATSIVSFAYEYFIFLLLKYSHLEQLY